MEHETIPEKANRRLKAAIKTFSKTFDNVDHIEPAEWIRNHSYGYIDDSHYRAKKLILNVGGPGEYFLLFENEDNVEYCYLEFPIKYKYSLNGNDFVIMSKIKDFLAQ